MIRSLNTWRNRLRSASRRVRHGGGRVRSVSVGRLHHCQLADCLGAYLAAQSRSTRPLGSGEWPGAIDGEARTAFRRMGTE